MALGRRDDGFADQHDGQCAIHRPGSGDRKDVARRSGSVGDNPWCSRGRYSGWRPSHAAIAVLKASGRGPPFVAGVALPLLALAFHTPVPVIAAGSFLGGASFAIFGGTVGYDHAEGDSAKCPLARQWIRLAGFDGFPSARLPIVGPIAAAVGSRAVFVTASTYMVRAVLLVFFIPAVRGISSPQSGRPEMPNTVGR